MALDRTPSSPPSLPVPRRLDDSATEHFRSDVHAFLTDLAHTPLPWGVHVQVALANGVATRVRHGLPRPPTGYIVVRKSAAVDVFDATPTGPTSDDTIWIQATADATVKIWFY